MAEDLPSGFYEVIDRKNWTVDVIQHGLRINNAQYTTIYTAIETEMRTHNILGHRLNKSHVKRQLNLLLDDIVCRFSTTFDNIPHSWRDKCLTAIAQKCNYNMRRQTMKQGSPDHGSEIMDQGRNLETTLSGSEAATDSKPEIGSDPRTKGIRTLDSIMVFITWGTGGRCTICRMVDFVTQGLSSSLTIESLSFDRFVSILKEEIQFDPAEHKISYACTRGMTVPIANERTWKAAIGDMYAGGMDTFDFRIEESGDFHIEEPGEYLCGGSRVYLLLANI